MQAGNCYLYSHLITVLVLQLDDNGNDNDNDMLLAESPDDAAVQVHLYKHNQWDNTDY